MVIEEEDFKMTSVDDTGVFWDLELLYTIKPKGKPERQELKDSGYGLQFLTCLKKIANFRVSRKKDIYSLKEYVKEYKKALDELKSLIKDI